MIFNHPYPKISTLLPSMQGNVCQQAPGIAPTLCTSTTCIRPNIPLRPAIPAWWLHR